MESSKQKLIEKLFDKGILVNKELIDAIESGRLSEQDISNMELESDIFALSDSTTQASQEHSKESEVAPINWYELEGKRVDFEDESQQELYETQLHEPRSDSLTISHSDGAIQAHQQLKSLETTLEESSEGPNARHDSLVESNVDTAVSLAQHLSLEEVKPINYTISLTFKHEPRKYTVKDFANFFATRYRFLEKIIRKHPEMKSVTAINRVLQKKEKETVAVIGLVYDIAQTKNNNFIVTLEDPTGKIKVLLKGTDKVLGPAARELIYDEVIGITGTNNGDIIFAQDLIWPDVPNTKEFKKAPIEEYAIFLSDIHVGSQQFLEEEFNRFLRWIRAEAGSTEQKAIAQLVKYIFIAGDVVDGIGIYAKQQSELSIDSIKGQYDEFTKLISKIPSDKQIFICPGNHDLVHLAEPQSLFYKEYTQGLHEMPNVHLLSNPSMVTIGKTPEFEGIDVMLYHGYSFDYYVANVDEIRNNGGYDRADLIMKFLLKRRHLAPAFKSTPYLPGHSEDPLLIKKVPDILCSGHIHYCSVANYKGITMICGSCWQAKTEFQEKVGHNPQPGRVPIVNLKTREVKVLKFV